MGGAGSNFFGFEAGRAGGRGGSPILQFPPPLPPFCRRARGKCDGWPGREEGERWWGPPHGPPPFLPASDVSPVKLGRTSGCQRVLLRLGPATQWMSSCCEDREIRFSERFGKGRQSGRRGSGESRGRLLGVTHLPLRRI